MPVLSYVHPLFTVDQCQADIHTLRWKDRPLPCPHDQSQDVAPWGMYHDRPECKRSWCRSMYRRRSLVAVGIHVHAWAMIKQSSSFLTLRWAQRMIVRKARQVC